MIRIGPWPAVTLTAARKAANGYAGDVARDKDPAKEKHEARCKAKATLGALLAEDGEYERNLKRHRVVNIKVILSGLRRGLEGSLMSKDVAEITLENFVDAITAIENQGKPGTAADLRKFVHTFLEWCRLRGFVNANTIGGYRREKKTRAEKVEAEARKARALNDGEIVAVWKACDGRGSFGNIVRLLLLSGARKSEIAKLTHDRILINKPIRDDILADFIELPPLSTKTGALHQTPLTEPMHTIIATQAKTTSAFVFASEVTGKPVQGWTKLVAGLQVASGVDFTVHDLRRTCRTLMSRFGVDTDIAKLAIGHMRKGLEKRYNFDEAWPLTKVSEHIAGLLDRAAEEVKVVRSVPIESICLAFQSAEHLIEDWVIEYVERMLSGEAIEPVTIYSDGRQYRLSDGFHRVEAARRLGRHEIEAEIRHGDRQDMDAEWCRDLTELKRRLREGG